MQFFQRLWKPQDPKIDLEKTFLYAIDIKIVFADEMHPQRFQDLRASADF